MKISWLAHASFLIEGDGLRIITDPYEPNETINLPPITVPADIVVRSSDDDEAHAYIETIPPGFELVTATDIVESGTTAHGIAFQAIWAEESHKYKEVVRDNAMYRFTVEGVNFTHMGDLGNPLTEEQLAALEGTDVLMALVGGPPTIELNDLEKVVAKIKPKVILPMHYRIPGPRFFMLPVTEFTSRYPSEMTEWLDTTSVEITADSLPNKTEIWVLKPTLFKEEPV